ncbi:MAG TPA: erythromycin esterase family protein [Actinomycetota bacterium]|nr:erythromycin esterase family protein [Actinomycetota bacterium]
MRSKRPSRQYGASSPSERTRASTPGRPAWCLGQLVRERHAGDGVVLVGFGGHRGTVAAADLWGETLRRKTIPEAPDGSHEDLLHRAVGKPALLVFPAGRRGPWLSSKRGHRAIGAVYSPGYERFGTWVPTVMGDRYDAFLYFEETRALTPLHPEQPQREGEQQTYPWSA